MTKLNLELAIAKDTYKPAYKSDALNKEFSKMASAVKAGNKAAWKFATAVHKVLTDELWKIQGDFESQAKFAKAIGKSEAQVTLYKNAVEFVKQHEELVTRDANGDINGGIPFSKADILSRIDNLDEFDAWCQENYKGCHIWEFGDNSIKKMYNSYKAPTLEDKTEDKAEDKTEDKAEDKAEDKTENKTEAKRNLSVISHDGYRVEYVDIPISLIDKAMELLSEYRVATYDNEGNKIDG